MFVWSSGWTVGVQGIGKPPSSSFGPLMMQIVLQNVHWFGRLLGAKSEEPCVGLIVLQSRR